MCTGVSRWCGNEDPNGGNNRVAISRNPQQEQEQRRGYLQSPSAAYARRSGQQLTWQASTSPIQTFPLHFRLISVASEVHALFNISASLCFDTILEDRGIH